MINAQREDFSQMIGDPNLQSSVPNPYPEGAKSPSMAVGVYKPRHQNMITRTDLNITAIILRDLIIFTHINNLISLYIYGSILNHRALFTAAVEKHLPKYNFLKSHQYIKCTCNLKNTEKQCAS
jgi:hypothetical protein